MRTRGHHGGARYPLGSRVRAYTPAVGIVIEVMHLLVVVAGVGLSGWSLVALRTTRPRGRLLVFGAGSAAALLGCAALGGELGILPPLAWLVILVTLMAAATAVTIKSGLPRFGAT